MEGGEAKEVKTGKQEKEQKAKEAKPTKTKEGKDAKNSKSTKDSTTKEGKDAREAKVAKSPKDGKEEKEKKGKEGKEGKEGKASKEKNDKKEGKEKKDDAKEKKDKKNEKGEKTDKKDKKKDKKDKKDEADSPSAKKQAVSNPAAQNDDDMLGPDLDDEADTKVAAQAPGDGSGATANEVADAPQASASSEAGPTEVVDAPQASTSPEVGPTEALATTGSDLGGSGQHWEGRWGDSEQPQDDNNQPEDNAIAGSRWSGSEQQWEGGWEKAKQPEEEENNDEKEAEDWEDCLEVEVGWDIGWDAKRLAVIETATGSKIKFDDQSGKAKCLNKPDGAALRAQYLLQVLAATKAGNQMPDDLAQPPEGLEVTILELPSGSSSQFLQNTSEKLLKAMEENNVIAAFVPNTRTIASTPAVLAEEPLQVGQQVEAKYGNSFFDAEVVETSDNGSVKVKYGYDGSEAEVPRSDIQCKTVVGTANKFEIGQVVEAKFGNSFFEAEVVELGSETAKVKYKYDGSIDEVQLADVKSKEDDQAPSDDEVFHIYGDPKARACMAVRTYLLAAKSCVDVASILARKQSDPREIVGLSIIPVEHAGRCIGTRGSVKAKISLFTGAALEFPGDRDSATRRAVVGGTAEEREQCLAMLELVQGTEKGVFNSEFPATLNSISTRVMVPQHAVRDIVGKGRMELNALEEELGVMCVSITTIVPAPPDATAGDDGLLLEPGSGVEAKYGSSYFEAEVVEVKGDMISVKYKYDDSTADVDLADVRGKPSPEVLAAREKHERLLSWHTWAILGMEEPRKEAARRMMAGVEQGEAGTYIGSGAVMPLSEEEQALLKLEVQRLNEKKEEESRWEEKKWQEDKWDSGKKDEWPQPQKWGEDKRGGWQEGDSSGSKWENSAVRGDDKDENASSWSDAQWSSGGGSSRGDGSWKQEGQSWQASSKNEGNKRDWDSSASSWQQPDVLDPGKRQRLEQPAPVSNMDMTQAGPNFTYQLPPQQQQQQQQPQMPPPCDPLARLQHFGFPTTTEQWAQAQDVIWEGHQLLPPGWIRCWSRSQHKEYYVRLVDNFSVFDLAAVMEAGKAI